MKKATISNRIYLRCEKDSLLESQLLKELKFEINQMPVSPYPTVINLVTRITDNVVSIPKGCEHLIPEDYEVNDKRVFPEVRIPKLKATLRDDQDKAQKNITGSGRIDAKPGWGKTFAGLKHAENLQTKTLIITTTTGIRDQWIQEIKEFMGFSPGVIGGGKFNIESPIVVGNIQTVRNRLEKLKREFGLVIIDEVHRASAPTFNYVLDTMHNKYSLGLSGTMKRKDGLHVVLPAYFGKELFHGKDENRLTPVVHLWQSHQELSSNTFIPWAERITQLLGNPAYREEILGIVHYYLKKGHKILITADRTEFLEDLHLCLPDDSFIITGKIKERQKIIDTIIKSSRPLALFATQSIFSEGISVNPLSVIIPATPISNDPLLEQLIGRIQRPYEGKTDTPIAADIAVGGQTGKRQANGRKRFYINKGWTIKKMN